MNYRIAQLIGKGIMGFESLTQAPQQVSRTSSSDGGQETVFHLGSPYDLVYPDALQHFSVLGTDSGNEDEGARGMPRLIHENPLEFEIVEVLDKDDPTGRSGRQRLELDPFSRLPYIEVVSEELTGPIGLTR